MNYSSVFGGGSINPSNRTYLELTISVSVVLQWPIEQQIGGDNIATDIIDINATAPGLNVDLSDARQVSDGFTSLFTNVGANAVTVRTSAGSTIISVAPGESWFVYLTDNNTSAGVWRTFQLGATVSVASASALAGAGLKAITTTLNQKIVPTSTAVTPITWADANRAQFTVWTGGVGVLDLPDPTAVGSDWFSIIRNEGSGDLTVTPFSGTINSAATLIMAPGTSAIIVVDGTNYFTIGLGQSTAGTFDFVEITVSGTGDFTLSGVQLNRISYKFVGVLTGNRNIIVPNTVQQYWVDNSTTGAFTLDIATVAQVTPVQVLQNNRSIFYCDGTDVIDAETGTLTPPISIGQGGTGAITAPLALTNLGAVPITLTITGIDGVFGGGALSANRTLELNLGGLGIFGVDTSADYFGFYDSSTASTKRAIMDTVIDAYSSQRSGSFTGTLTGFASSPTPTVQYYRTGDRVTLYLQADATATSNATSFSMTGVPAAIRPTNDKEALVILLDSGSQSFGRAVLSSTGVILFAEWTGSSFGFNSFTASGNKGLLEGWSFSYILD